MARTLREINSRLNHIINQNIPNGIKSKSSIQLSNIEVNIESYWNNYLRDSGYLFLKNKRLENLNLKSINTVSKPGSRFNTPIIINFIASVYGKKYISDFLVEFYPKPINGQLSYYAKTQADKYTDNIVNIIVSEIKTEHKLKLALQNFVLKAQKRLKNQKILNKYKQKTISCNNYADHVSRLLELDEQVGADLNSLFSLQGNLLKDKLLSEEHYAPAIDARRKSIRKAEEKISKIFKKLYSDLYKDLFIRDAEKLLSEYTIINNRVLYKDISVFQKLYPDYKRHQEINKIILDYLDSKKNKYQDFKSTVLTRFVKANIKQESVPASEADSIVDGTKLIMSPHGDRPDLNSDTMVTQAVTKTRDYIPSLSDYIDAIPAGFITTIGALTRDYIHTVGINGNGNVSSARSLSYLMHKSADIKSNSMEHTNNLLQAINPSGNGTMFHADIVLNTGLLAHGLKFINSCFAIFNSIQAKLKVNRKRGLLYKTVSDIVDHKLWQTIEIMQQSSVDIGLIDHNSSKSLEQLYYGAIKKYNPREGFLIFQKKAD